MTITAPQPAPPHATPPNAPTLVVRGLSVRYDNDTPALDDIGFTVASGERVAIVGPNGAGKSTLLKTIAGLITPTHGTITVNGHQHTMCSDVAYVPQRAKVDWSFPIRVWDVVLLGRTGHIGWFGRVKHHDRELVQHSLELVAMADLAHRQIGELSGGQQQRVFIARALAQQACVLLLDEPVNGLDVHAQNDVLHIIDDIHQQGVTVLTATHDLQQASDATHYEQILLLNRRLIGHGNATDVMTAANLTAAYGSHMHRIETEQGTLLVHDRH